MSAKKVTGLLLKFVCPECGAPPHKHGKGGKNKCQSEGACDGFICDCDPRDCPESEEKDHGTSFTNRCTTAVCHHCGWGGTVPRKPKNLAPWEKTAIAAGWTPPEKRLKEIS